MSWLKSKFVVIFMTLIGVASVHSFLGLYQASATTAQLLWISALVSVVPLQVFFLGLMARPVARTSARLYPLLGSSAIGAAAAIYLTIKESTGITFPLVYATDVGLLGGVLYVYWYSSFGGRENNNLLAVGNDLPAFELEDTQGNTVTSASFVGKPALMIFYRGNWCPLCMAQIKEVASQYKALADQGVKVALVSPQSHENSESLAKKFDVPFMFLVDKDNRAAKALDILSENGTPTGLELLGYDSDTVMPTVLITDEKGKIIFADLTDNYRVRPEPDTFIEVLKSHGALQA
ncbi:peroxiredoxin family protein [Gammaproteobacteria bacterium]|nr:peroxiredoxin family protein [Gammaproteobacteria bacterium]